MPPYCAIGHGYAISLFLISRCSILSRHPPNMSGSGNLLPKFMPISFSRVYLVVEVFLGGRKTAQKKNKFLGTEVPRNFSDQCSLDFAYFLCLFSGRGAKSSQELCSWELFFLILGGFSPSEFLGNENSARSFSDRSFFEPPWGHGRPRLRVMDVRTEILVFPGFRGLDRSFCPRTSGGIIRVDVRRMSGPKTYSLGCFFVLEFQDTSHSNKENPSACWHATLSCPSMASNYASLYLAPISF